MRKPPEVITLSPSFSLPNIFFYSLNIYWNIPYPTLRKKIIPAVFFYAINVQRVKKNKPERDKASLLPTF
jgi:hypothetical protein